MGLGPKEDIRTPDWLRTGQDLGRDGVLCV